MELHAVLFVQEEVVVALVDTRKKQLLLLLAPTITRSALPAQLVVPETHPVLERIQPHVLLQALVHPAEV